MAKKIPNNMVPHIIKMSPQEEYNWTQYDDGDWWELRRGTDYMVQTNSARTSAKKWADDNGRKAELGNLKDHDGFVVRFTKD